MSSNNIGGKVNVISINPLMVGENSFNPEIDIIYNGNQKIIRQIFDGRTFELTITYDLLGRITHISKWVEV